MTKKIFEELPARKHAPAAAPAAAKGGEKRGGTGDVKGEGSEKKIRQAVYDIRYRARREGIDLRAAYSQYMSNSNLTAPEQAAVRAKLFGKDGGGDKKESYDALMADGATTSVANAMFKVFVEKTVQEEVIQEDETSEKKYKVRVTDPKSERTYVRYADREKITALRAKGLKVEMTEHGDPYEGKKKEVPNKGGLDKPVAPSKRDGDVNDDGKKDGTDKYIYNRRDAINKAIERKKGMKEEFLADATTSTEGQNKGKITGTGVDNSKLIKVNPESEADVHRTNRKGLYAHADMEISSSRTRLLEMIAEKKKADACAHNAEGKECGVHGMKACPGSVSEGMGGDCGPEDKKKEDMRDKRTYRELLKNKLRAMGMKNPMMLDTPDSEEKVMKIMTSSSAKMSAMGESLEKEAAADNETRRLGKEAMRRAGSKKGGRMTTTTVQDREAAREMKRGGANNYKLPTRPADGSGTGI
jgi:hypothetical protein|tara:strand:+ start:583 stop:1995 length:1413 start_codon:yes stop_codon:yes gene_type:complete